MAIDMERIRSMSIRNIAILLVFAAAALMFMKYAILAVGALAIAGLLFWYNRDIIFEKYEDMQVQMMAIGDNTVPANPNLVGPNRVNEYVPYTMSPYLAAKYESGNITAFDGAFSGREAVSSSYPGPMDMNPFKDNKASPQACLEGNAMYSTDMGCIKLTPQQMNYMAGRAENMDRKFMGYI